MVRCPRCGREWSEKALEYGEPPGVLRQLELRRAAVIEEKMMAALENPTMTQVVGVWGAAKAAAARELIEELGCAVMGQACDPWRAPWGDEPFRVVASSGSYDDGYTVGSLLVDDELDALYAVVEGIFYGPGITAEDVAGATVTDEDVEAVLEALDGGLLVSNKGSVIEVSPAAARDAIAAVISSAAERG